MSFFWGRRPAAAGFHIWEEVHRIYHLQTAAIKLGRHFIARAHLKYLQLSSFLGNKNVSNFQK